MSSTSKINTNVPYSRSSSDERKPNEFYRYTKRIGEPCQVRRQWTAEHLVYVLTPILSPFRRRTRITSISNDTPFPNRVDPPSKVPQKLSEASTAAVHPIYHQTMLPSCVPPIRNADSSPLKHHNSYTNSKHAYTRQSPEGIVL